LRVGRLQDAEDRLGDIGDVDRLEARSAAAAEHREDGREARQCAEAVQKSVFGPEHYGRPHDGGARKGGAHLGLAVGLRARVGRAGVRRCSDGRAVDELRNARGKRRPRHARRTPGVDRGKGLLAVFG
jgi:hypothetical protein